MITEPTLIILGAGASKPYGFPTGYELRKLIINSFPLLIKQYFEYGDIPEEIIINSFVESFKKSSDLMIDYFLATRNEFSKIGKWAIYITIADAEKKSCFREESIDNNDDWMSYLFFRMTNGLNDKNLSTFKDNKINFISFNYDRSLEYFLSESLIHKFNLRTATEVNSLMETFKIYHVFGRLPALPYEGEPFLRYRNTETLYKFLEDALVQFKTLCEREDCDSVITKELLSKAKKIIFLGFGYADENLRLLNIYSHFTNSVNVYGTAFGLSPNQIKNISDKMYTKVTLTIHNSTVMLNKPKLINCKSKELLEECL